MPVMLSVSIIILNYNGMQDTLECLASLDGLDYPDYEVLVVDNGSTDDSVAAVRERFTQARLIQNRENLGFAAGCNAGIRDALGRGADYVLLINNDTVVTDPSFLATLVDFYERTPDAGAVGPVITYKGSDVVWYAGARISYLTGFSRHIGKGARLGELPSRDPYAVDYVSGCAMLLGRKFLTEVGLLDPDYFFYYEDADLCFRGAAASYRNYVVPASVFSHEKSATAGVAGRNKLTPFQAYHFAFNAVMFGRKNLRGWRRRAFLLAQYTVRPALNLPQLRGRGAMGEYLRGLREAAMFSFEGSIYPVDLAIVKHEVRYGLYRRLFTWLQRHGFHLTPVNYYFPVPDTRCIPPETWEKPSQLAGVDLNEQGQLELLDEFAASFKEEYESFPRHRTEVPWRFYLRNNFFGPVDAEALYCMIRRFKPRRIIEIGSGNSTMLAAQAALLNQQETGVECELTAIEPFPNPLLRAGFPGLTRLESNKLEEVPLDRFTSLEENDILFIDSSHVLRIGGDVQYEFLEILPRLKPGVIVHVHDIMLPMDYDRKWVLEQCRFYTEQYLLQAFLALNDSFEVMLAAAFLASSHPADLQRAFSSFDPQMATPVSFWMRRVK